MNRRRNQLLARLLLLAGLVAGGGPLAAADLTATAAVEKQTAFVGEAFVFQIQIEGHEAPDKPDLSGLRDFAIEDLGGQQNSSQQVTVVNGRMSRVEHHGYVFSYRLTPQRAGRLPVPAITVTAGGATARTRPFAIEVRQPAETTEFKLRCHVTPESCYVGQPVTLALTWYVGRDVAKYDFNLSVLTDDRFTVLDCNPAVDQQHQDQYLQLALARDHAVIATKSQETLDGKAYLAVRFEQTLIPLVAGELTLPPATVSCHVAKGRTQARRQDPFESFLGDGFFGGRVTYEQSVVPANQPTLAVKELPAAGRPPDFNGLVGVYRLATAAKPTTVNVGDPITLTMRISGPKYLGNVKAPLLTRQANLVRDFQIPSDMAPGKVDGEAIVFTQTLRARTADVKEIPPLELPYFDADRGAYATARSAAIPLTVNATRVLTAADAEGRAAAPGSAASRLDSVASGIAHNYTGLTALTPQRVGSQLLLSSPAAVAALGAAPLGYLVLLLAVSVARARRADPARRQAQEAYGRLRAGLKALPADGATGAAVLALLQNYLGSKLRLAAGAITFKDVEPRLRERGVADAQLARLQELFAQCEAGRYAGGAAGGQAAALAAALLAMAAELERRLR